MGTSYLAEAAGELIAVADADRIGEIDFKSGRVKKAAPRPGAVQ